MAIYGVRSGGFSNLVLVELSAIKKHRASFLKEQEMGRLDCLHATADSFTVPFPFGNCTAQLLARGFY